MIQGVKTKVLKVISDERGRLMEMLRADDPFFIRFGQVYMTTAYPGTVKAWHYHKKQFDHFVVVKGMMKVVLYDGREKSPTFREINEFFMGGSAASWRPIPLVICRSLLCARPWRTTVTNTAMPVIPATTRRN